MPSFPQSLRARPVVLQVPNPLPAGRGELAERSPHTPRGNGQWPAEHTLVSDIRRNSPQGYWGYWWKCSQATFHHLINVLANWTGTRWPVVWKLPVSRAGNPGSDKKFENGTHLQKGLENDQGHYRPVNLTLMPGLVMKRIILSAIIQYMQDIKGVGPHQPGWSKASPIWSLSMMNWPI